MDMFSIDEMTGKDLSYLKEFDLQLVDTDEKFSMAREVLLSAKKPIALDTETTGLSPMHHKIVGLILAPSTKQSFYFPIRHKVGFNIEESKVTGLLTEVNNQNTFIFHNAKFDWKMVYSNWGIDLNIFADTMIMAYIVNSNLAESGGLSLKHLTERLFNYKPLELSDFDEYDFSNYDTEQAYLYAAPDGTNTYKLYEKFLPAIKANKLERVMRLEHLIIKMLGHMELEGVMLDTQYLKDNTENVKALIDELTQKVYEQAGKTFDVSSPKQLSEVLYQDLQIKPTMSHGKPDYSTGAQVLGILKDRHPIVQTILDLREAQKLYSDFILKLPESISEDQRIHTNFKQTGTKSGRFSSSGGAGRNGMELRVNLQQIPNDSKLADGTLISIRKAFIPRPGYYWVSCDYSTLEYRMLANMAYEEGLIEQMQAGVDFHKATASLMFNIPVDQVTKHDRARGKCVTGDTLIPTSTGLRYITDFYVNTQASGTFVPLRTFVQDRHGDFKQTDSFYYSGVHPVTKVSTAYGFEIKGTTDKHQILVMDNTTSLPHYKKLSDIQPGDYALLFTGGYKNTVNHVLPMPKVDAANDYSNHAKKDRVIHTVTSAVAELWGMILADGNFTTNGVSIVFRVLEKHIAERFRDLVATVYGYTPNIKVYKTSRHKSIYSVVIHSVIAVQQFSVHEKGNKSHTMHIPAEILRSSQAVQAAFIKGYMLGDSSFQAKKISMGSVSERFIYELQQLFLSFGIVTARTSTVPKSMKDREGYRYWELNIVYPDSYKRLQSLITFGDWRDEKLQGIIENLLSARSGNPVAGGIQVLADKAISGVKASDKDKANLYGLRTGKRNSCGIKDIATLAMSESVTSEEKRFLEDLRDFRCLLVEVKSVEDMPPEPLYDFSVPEGHEFIHNGTVGHNTCNFSIVYGLSDNGLSAQLGVSLEDAKVLRAKYFENLPNVINFMDGQKKMVLEKGSVKTVSGRIRSFKQQIAKAKEDGYDYGIIQAQKQGANTAVQGSAADLAKLAMWRLDEMLKPYKGKIIPIMQVHDAIDFEVSDDIPKEEFIQLVDAAMSFRGVVPGWADIPVDFEFGSNYGEMQGPEELGIDMKALLADNPFLAKVPDCSWFFDPIIKEAQAHLDKSVEKHPDDGTVFLNKEAVQHQEQMDSKKKELLQRFDNVPKPQETPAEQAEPVNTQTSALTHSAVIIRPTSTDTEVCLKVLDTFITNHFGDYDLIIEDGGRMYQFPADYRVSKAVTPELRSCFDVRLHEVQQAGIKLEGIQ